MSLRGIVVVAIFIVIFVRCFGNPFFALMTYVFCGYVRPERFTYGETLQFRLYMVLGIILLISFLLRKRKDVVLPCKRSYIAVVLIAVFATISSFNAQVDSSLSFQWSNTLVTIAVVSYILRIMLVERGTIEGYLVAILSGSSFIALWSFQQHFLGNVRLEEVAGGNFNDSNSIAMLMVQIIPLLLYLTFNETGLSRQRSLRLCYGAVAAVAVSVIIFSESRAGFLGCGLSIAVLLMGLSFKQRFRAFLALLVMFPIFMMVSSSVENYKERVKIDSMAEETGGREVIWPLALHAFKEHKLTGVGQQNFKYLARGYAESLGLQGIWFRQADAHNTFLLYAAEGGGGQVAAFIALIIFFFLDCRFLILSKDAPCEKMLYWALAASMVGLVVTNCFHSYPAHENILFFLVIPECIRNIKHNVRRDAYNLV